MYWIEKYNKRNNQVIQYFNKHKKNKFLALDVTTGENHCEFLGKSNPNLFGLIVIS